MNIFDVPQRPLSEELPEILTERGNIRIERIISTGQASDWNDQSKTEFVVRLDDNAVIEFENGECVTASKGDTLLITPHERHGVYAGMFRL